MTISEYREAINILIDSYATDPMKWDTLTREYQNRMMRNYGRHFINLDGKRFMKACDVLSKNQDKFPNCHEMLRQYRETETEYQEEKFDTSKITPMPDTLKDIMKKWEEENKFDMEKTTEDKEDELPF